MGTEDVGALRVRIIADTTAMQSALARGQRSVKTFSGRVSSMLGGIGQTMVTYFKLALPLAIGASIREFAKFEKQMAMVNTMLTKQTAHFLPKFTKALARVSRSYGEGTKTLSKGLYDILSASIPADKAIKVLITSVRAAKAGFTETAVAADAITTILNAYSLEAEQAGDVSDLLFAIVKRGKLTFNELASNIGKVASIAATAGLSLEDMGAALATMTRAGLQSDIAITSLRAIILAFLDPQEDAKKAAAEFGIELSSATLKAEGLTGVIRKLKGATAEQLLQMIPSARAIAGFAAALQNAEEMSEDYEFMLNRAGLETEAFEKATDTLSQTMSEFWQMLKQMARDIGSLFDPIKEPIEGLIEAYNTLRNLRLKERTWRSEMTGMVPETPELRDTPRTQEEMDALYKEIDNRKRKNTTGFGTIGFMSEEDAEALIAERQAIRRSEEQSQIEKFNQHKLRLHQRYIKRWMNEQDKLEEAQAEAAEEMKRKWAEVGQTMEYSMASQFDAMLFEGKKFADAFKAIVRDLIRTITREMFINPLVSRMFGALESPTVVTPPVAHSGWDVGAGFAGRKQPAMMFAGAPRLHGGLENDEFPAVLQRGETVTPAGQSDRTVRLELINETGRPMQTVEGGQRFDGTQLVQSVFLRDLGGNGPMGQAIDARARR